MNRRGRTVLEYIIKLGGGNDTYVTEVLGADGIDTVSGGGGIDRYVPQTNESVRINLDIIAHDRGPFFPGADFLPANTATGDEIAKDTIIGFENVEGTADADIIYGTASANSRNGLDGGDVLNGYGGNDTLLSGFGSDHLYGGAGKDRLSGGLDSDRFQYAKVTDSGVTKATRDVITDFAFGGVFGFDIIDLSLIDANTKVAGAQAFDYLNDDSSLTPAANFTLTAGELRSIRTVDGNTLEGDVNGDGKADFAIELLDPSHATTLLDNIFFL